MVFFYSLTFRSHIVEIKTLKISPCERVQMYVGDILLSLPQQSTTPPTPTTPPPPALSPNPFQSFAF
jgi:hypothetical protein